jgi:hypothetical protein
MAIEQKIIETTNDVKLSNIKDNLWMFLNDLYRNNYEN